LERREGFGITTPDPIPHPDDIIIDMKTGSVRMKGPFTKEEKPAWDKLRARKRNATRRSPTSRTSSRTNRKTQLSRTRSTMSSGSGSLFARRYPIESLAA